MKARAMIIALISSLMTLTVDAQNVVEQMNAVKGNPDFCYGEGADIDPQKAHDLALEELVSELSKKAGIQVSKEDIRGKASKLERKRGEQTRMLVYVSLAEYGKVTSSSANVVTPVKEPVQTIVQEVEPAVEQPSVLQPQQTVVIQTNDEERQPIGQNVQRTDYSKAGNVVQQMKMVKHTNAMKKLLVADMEGGLIKSFGTPSNAKDMDNVYWWVFRKGEPMQYVAVLSPVKANGKRDNLDTGEEQTLLDFQGAEYGTVWFTLP